MWVLVGTALLGVAAAAWWALRTPRALPEDDFKSLFGVPSDYGRWEESPR